jgi:putative ABC transport system permease protein
MTVFMKRFIYEFNESFRIAFEQIYSNKMRSLLTALGVIIGIIAVTLMGTAINGIDKGFDQSLSMIGYDVLYVEKFSWTGDVQWWEARNRRDLKTEYADKINKMAESSLNSDIVRAVPRSIDFKTVKYGESQINGTFTVGTTYEFPIVSTIDISDGRFFSEIESRNGRPVCMIGFDIAEGLFPNTSPIGKKIQIGNVQCEVIGIFAKQGKFLGLFSWDSQVVMPLEVTKKYFGGDNRTSISIKIKDKTRVTEAKDELTGIMRRVRGLMPDRKEDFSINEQQAFKSTLDPIKSGIALAGLFITGLSLFVGAIGIMNITFVSVKERTKEIGTRKALGARRRTILMQFLIEAVSICLIGGVVGLVVSWLMSLGVAAAAPNFPVSFSVSLVLVGMITSVVTGIVSGFAPAYSASKLDPVVALRYE